MRVSPIVDMAEFDVIVLSSDDESGGEDFVSLGDQEERLEAFLARLCGEVDEEAKGLVRLRFRQCHPLYLKSKAFEEELSRCTDIVNSGNVHVLVADVLDLLEKNSRVTQVKEQWNRRRYDTPERDPSQEQTTGSFPDEATFSERETSEFDRDSSMSVSMASALEHLNGEGESGGERLRGETTERNPSSGTSTLQERLSAMKQRKVKNLERKLEVLSKHIRRCEEIEIDFDDLDNEHSTYLMEDKLKRKYLEVQGKLCRLKDEILDTSDRSFKYSGSEYDMINKVVTRWVRKNKDFPDVDDIREVVKKANKRHDLGMSDERVREEAKTVMMDLGKKLQEFRQKQFVRDFGSHLTDSIHTHEDPAYYNDDLRVQLEQQDAFYEEAMENLMEDFVRKQEKIGDTVDTQTTPTHSPTVPSQVSGEDSVEEEV
ncbi:death domain-associated protein 6-like [Corticium candelabrum]|uniref:death domain-associated protein 6-like n=1 Tax=Corticium candelabrum TaxID=121492 RepID=UPI002E26630F|nr:death domain-associated protein 6-like [Corticium candelabrum]